MRGEQILQASDAGAQVFVKSLSVCLESQLSVCIMSVHAVPLAALLVPVDSSMALTARMFSLSNRCIVWSQSRVVFPVKRSRFEGFLIDEISGRAFITF